MKAVILAGGFGSRLSEATNLLLSDYIRNESIHIYDRSQVVIHQTAY